MWSFMALVNYWHLEEYVLILIYKSRLESFKRHKLLTHLCVREMQAGRSTRKYSAVTANASSYTYSQLANDSVTTVLESQIPRRAQSRTKLIFVIRGCTRIIGRGQITVRSYIRRSSGDARRLQRLRLQQQLKWADRLGAWSPASWLPATAAAAATAVAGLEVPWHQRHCGIASNYCMRLACNITKYPLQQPQSVLLFDI